MSEALESLARRVARDPFFLAAPLARYANAQGLDDTALAARLGCPVEALTELRLCGNPDSQPPRFWRDVGRIAAHFHLDPDLLAQIVRDGQALFQLSVLPEKQVEDVPGSLMAARENEQAEPPKPGGPQ